MLPLKNDLVAYVTAGVIVALMILSIYQKTQIDTLELKNKVLTKSVEAEKLRNANLLTQIDSQNKKIEDMRVEQDKKQKTFYKNIAKIESDYDKKRQEIVDEVVIDSNCSCDCGGIEKILLQEWGR